jgi:hypothetical protein
MPTRFQFICVNGDRQSVIYYLVTLADLRVIFNNPNLSIFQGKEEYLKYLRRKHPECDTFYAAPNTDKLINIVFEPKNTVDSFEIGAFTLE